ncbi:MAG: hypothetical protein KatS3mg111_1953 [Pirellulaceae bacterium]|nr:MAG: hypothetical protein KatS3mg111_1953 [Pirellulaceae bacterium]
MKMHRLRKTWLQIHRWLGVWIGLLFALVGLTGSLLVFDHAIDEWLNPELLLTKGNGSRRPLTDVVRAAEQYYAPPEKTAFSVNRPRVPNGVWTVWFVEGSAHDRKFVAVYVDPYTAQVTGRRVWGEDLMSGIYNLHFRLMAGRPGGIIVGLIGCCLLLSIATGLWLWWPLWKRSWRAAFAVRRGRLLNFDIHKVVGTISSAFLVTLAFTGVYMEFPGLFKKIVTSVAPLSHPPEGLQSTRQEGNEPISPDAAVAIAQQRFPNAQFDHLHLPTDDDGVYEVALRQPDEIQESFGRTQVFIDQYDGSILAVYQPADYTAADAFFAWQFPLHNGEAFGLVGRWFVLVAGLTPSILYVTGIAIWWRKSRTAKQRMTPNPTGERSSAIDKAAVA